MGVDVGALGLLGDGVDVDDALTDEGVGGGISAIEPWIEGAQDTTRRTMTTKHTVFHTV